MQEIQCPQCGDWLGVPPEYAHKPVRCGSCQRVIEPAERRAPSPPADRGPRFPDREDDAAYHRPRRRGSGLWVWAVLALVGVGCCGCGGVGLLFWGAANPPWEKFTHDKGEFTAEFPGKPNYQSHAFAWPDGTTGTTHEYNAWKANNFEGFAVHYLDWPKGGTRGRDEFLIDLFLDDFKKTNTHGYAEASKGEMTTYGKYKGRETEGTINDPQYGQGYAHVRVMVVGDRGYMLIAVGKEKGKLVADKDRFFNSFQPVEPKAKEKAK